jgi:phosphate acetyltransferase
MSNNLYITAMEPRSGKSVVLLGIMEMLSRHIRQIGFFRPVIHSTPEFDNDIQLVLSRYNRELLYEET